MNMLIRYFFMLALMKIQTKHHAQPAEQTDKNQDELGKIAQPITQSHRILPHDMGFRDHVPNYRYLSFIELNITHWLIQTCQRQGKSNLLWLIAMQEMVYLKPVKIFSRLKTVTRVIGWDSKYVYLQTDFFVKRQLTGTALTKVLLVNKQGKIPPAYLGMTDEQLTPTINTWNAHQQALKDQ